MHLERVSTLTSRLGLVFRRPGARFLLVIALLMLGLFAPAQPAHAVGSYNNATIADIALTKLGQYGDECKTFANNMVFQASNGTQWPAPGYHDGFHGVGGVEVSSAAAVKGDIIQVGNSNSDWPLHTAIIVSNNGGGNFTVVDSNWNHDKRVTQHSFNPYTWGAGSSIKIWRMGTAQTSGGSTSQPVVSPSASKNKVVATTTPDGYSHVFSAAASGVYETYWKPGAIAPKTGKLVNISDPIAIAVSYDGVFTNVYTATSTAIYETYWVPGTTPSTGPVVSLPGITAFVKTVTADGYHHIYTATSAGGYETYWKPGVSTPVTSKMVNIPNLIDVTVSYSNGVTQMYTATATSVHETYWGGGLPLASGTIASLSNVTGIVKTVTADGYHHVFTATDDKVYETYWKPAAIPLATGVVFTKPGIKEIAVSYDGSYTNLYTSTGSVVYESYWQQGSAISSGTLVARPDITGIVKSVTPDGYHHVYLNTLTQVTETYWKPAATPVVTGVLGTF